MRSTFTDASRPLPASLGGLCCLFVLTAAPPLAGVLALFKGMGTPLASAALVNAICFGAYAQSQRVGPRCFFLFGYTQRNRDGVETGWTGIGSVLAWPFSLFLTVGRHGM